ncbi:MAG TPA: ClbS/DfsB family four-helix bundle protein, partial [Epsilonproteobacteria bacterium]|nr:ClbS/DfsB family four-helix bundle protein [Campylobacterota bacterium]
MPRPKNKEELLSKAKENFEKLYALIDSFTAEQKEAEYLFDNHRDKNIR